MWSSRGTTLAYTVLCHLSVRVHDYWYSNFFTATNCLQPFSINISPLVLPTCRRMWSIALFQPSGFWLVTRNMSQRARLAHCSGMVTCDDRQKNTWSNRTNHVAECTNICQPRARDQQSILLKAHWSIDIVNYSVTNQSRQAATPSDILLLLSFVLTSLNLNL